MLFYKTSISYSRKLVHRLHDHLRSKAFLSRLCSHDFCSRFANVVSELTNSFIPYSVRLFNNYVHVSCRF
jgi:hypothetical protein